MSHNLTRAAGAVVIAASLSIGGCPAPADARPAPSPAPVPDHTAGRVAPCRDDSGSSRRRVCVWDARHMGNGRGRSFYAYRNAFGGDPVIRYVSHRRAHRALNGAVR